MLLSHKSRTARLISVESYTGCPFINTSNLLKSPKDRWNSSDTFPTGLNTEANVAKLLHCAYVPLLTCTSASKFFFKLSFQFA
jgi:hypothetical protein